MNERIGVGLSGVIAMTSLLACQPAERLEAGGRGQFGVTPVVAVRSGRAFAAWHRNGNVLASSYENSFRTGPAWSAPQVLGSGTLPVVAAASDQAVVGYGRGYTFLVSVRSGASWSPPASPGMAYGLTYGVAQQVGGRTIAVWGGLGGVLTATLERGVWQNDLRTLYSTRSVSNWPQVAVNDSGVAFAAGCGDGGDMWGARRVYPGPWESTVLSFPRCCQSQPGDAPGPAPSVSLGVDASGQAVAVGNGGTRFCEMRHVPGSGWHGAILAGTPDPDGAPPQLAVNPSGQALLAWTNDGDKLVKAQAYQPGSGWGPILVGPAAETGRLGVGIGSTGNGAIVYRSAPGTISAVAYVDGALTYPSEVASVPGSWDALTNLSVGYDASESAQGVAVWDRVGGGDEVWASRLGL